MVDWVALADVALGFFFVVLALFVLGRYQRASRRLAESAELNQDLWRATEERLKKQDERILDLLGRVEVIQAHYLSEPPKRPVIIRDATPAQQVTYIQPPREPTPAPRPQPEADDTEKAILNVLAAGPKSTIEVKKAIAKSREHTARMLKQLFDRGLVSRDDSEKPFVYQLTEEGRKHLA